MCGLDGERCARHDAVDGVGPAVRRVDHFSEHVAIGEDTDEPILLHHEGTVLARFIELHQRRVDGAPARDPAIMGQVEPLDWLNLEMLGDVHTNLPRR